MIAELMLIIAIAVMLVYEFVREPRSLPPQVLDGDQAHIRTLEHELGLCEDAIYVPGEHWMVCSAMYGRRLDVRPAEYDVIAPRRKRKVTNNFTEENAARWMPHPPAPSAKPERFER